MAELERRRASLVAPERRAVFVFADDTDRRLC